MKTTFLVQVDRHQTFVEVTPSSHSHPDVPRRFTVCHYALQPCCDKSPATETVLSRVDGEIASELESGTFLRGKYHITRPDEPRCEQTGEEDHTSARSQAPDTLPRAHALGGSETWVESQGQALSPPPDGDPSTLRLDDLAPSTASNNRPSKGKRRTSAEIAEGIAEKLLRGIKKLAEDKSPVLGRAPDATSTWIETSGSIKQLADDLWNEAAGKEDTAHGNRLLSSFCHLYVKKNVLASDGDRRESKSNRQKKARHAKGAMLLSWIVDGLYPCLGLKALLYYWAACKVGYMLAGVAHISLEQRKHIAKLVIESLCNTGINVAGHARVLHPGIFLRYYNLKYHKRKVELSEVCKDLELMNFAQPISVSDSEVAEYAWGVPISYLRSQLGEKGLLLNGQIGWVSVDNDQEGDQTSEQRETQHIESQAERSSSSSTNTSELHHADIRLLQHRLDPYLVRPVAPGIEHQPDPAEDIGIPTADSSDVDTESNSASLDTYSDSSTSTQPQPGGKRKRRASDTECLPRSNPRPANSDCNNTETGSRGEQRTASDSAGSPRSETERRGGRTEDQSNAGPGLNSASISDALLLRTHNPNTPRPPATHSEAGEDVSFGEGGPIDTDGEGTSGLEWLLGNNAFEELAWDTPGLYRF